MRRFLYLFLLISTFCFSQSNDDTPAISVKYLRGNVLPHTPDLYHLQGHPTGVMIDFVKQTHGKSEWHSAYNFPDYGAFFLYQNFNNPYIGSNYSVGALYNFYFLKRNLKLLLSQGVAMTTNPYDRVENSKNKAFGSKILANTNLGLFYKKENIVDRFGLEAGILFTHYSNGRTKSPNSGVNTYGVNLGINYNLEATKKNSVDTTLIKASYKEPVKFNFVFRSGVNESPVIGSGQHPFYHVGFYADKRLNRKSALQLGTEVFLTTSFKDYIKYKSNAYPELAIDPNTDYKRIGVFIGHELFVNKISLEAQIGYYVYDPFKNEISIYDRVGMKYYFSNKFFAGFTIKTHLFLAEALEFGVGVRL